MRDLPPGNPLTQAESGGAVKATARYFPTATFDEFLAAHEADALLSFALANEKRFEPSTVVRPDGQAVDRQARFSFDFRGELEEWANPISRAIRARAGELADSVGVPRFAVGRLELTLSAYRDGCFYTAHIDTLTGNERKEIKGARALTAVYYVNRQPARFTGGVLELVPLVGKGDPFPLPPRHNRLVAFPSMALHRVTRASVPGDRFEDARFSVNCWLHPQGS